MRGTDMSWVLIVLVAGTLAAAIVDVRTRRIPNALTATMAVAAVVLHIADGVTPLLLVAAVMVGSFALGAVAFSAGWFGGGDVKLIAAACGLVSYPLCISLVCFILIAGAVLALAQAARHRRLGALVRDASRVATTGVSPESPTLLPYGVAIAGGSAVLAGSTFFPTLRLPF
jgi:prepilin peptidase CpaA